RELVGHHAHAPAARVAVRAALPVGGDLMRRVLLAPLAEGTEAAGSVQRGAVHQVVRTLGPVFGDDYPAAYDRIFTQVGHGAFYGVGKCLTLQRWGHAHAS